LGKARGRSEEMGEIIMRNWDSKNFVCKCKGAYASVRPYRHTYGNYGIRWQTWTRVIVNRCIGKIIARDLSLVASRLYRMAVTRTWVTCRRYIIPLFRRRPPGLHKPYKRKGKERESMNETIILLTQSYEPITPTTDRYSSMATFLRIRCTGKLHLHWLVVKTHADAICTGPRSKEEKKRREKQENI